MKAKMLSNNNDTGVWVIRGNGLPRLLVEAASKESAEAMYKKKLLIKSVSSFGEFYQCQHPLND
jgi:hypothetical protein